MDYRKIYNHNCTIEAMQYDGTNGAAVISWSNDVLEVCPQDPTCLFIPVDKRIVFPNEYVFRNPGDTFYLKMAAAHFEAGYEPVP